MSGDLCSQAFVGGGLQALPAGVRVSAQATSFIVDLEIDIWLAVVRAAVGGGK